MNYKDFIRNRIFQRFFEILIVLLLFPMVMVICLLLAIFIKATSPGPILFWSTRVGACGRLFLMPKFRTMTVDAPLLASHLLANPEQLVTGVGHYLRRYSLDELPQFWSVFLGEMALVGPRPALPSQLDLMGLRKVYGIDVLRPGITGWAQVNGRDELSIFEKVQMEVIYLDNRSLIFDLKIILITIRKVFSHAGVTH